ncbi:MAG: POTRA domain-containing protein [Methylococcaceae bacterium]|nr:POTRA domain-containing protein [Methylococcaceae bacterium]
MQKEIKPVRFDRSQAIALSFILLELNPVSALAQADKSGGEAPRFDIWEYRVEGSTVLETRVIEKTVYGFLGPGKSIENVEQARSALETAYHDAGYPAALVDIPEQDVREGVVVLKVSEGKIDRLKVSGSHYFSLGKIKERVPALAEGKPLYLPKAQEELGQLAGQSADRSVSPILRAGRTPGTVEVDLTVKDELPLHGAVEINGRNSYGTSRLRLTGMLRYDNLWQRFHSASLQYQISPENPANVEVWAGTYVMPIDSLGVRLVLYGIGLDSNSNISTTGSMTVVGSGDIYGLRLIKSLPGSKRFNHSFTFGWDYKDFDQSVNLPGHTPRGHHLLGSDTQNTPITYAPFNLAYSGGFNYGDGSATTFNVETDFSFRGLGNDPKQFENKRAGSRANYFALSGDLKHRQVLPADFILQARLSGQIADSPLISNEQFGAGGWQTVRGYHETERLGDDGVNGSLELYSPDLGKYLHEGLNQLRFLAFGDAARLWINKPLLGTPTRYDLLSAGLGFRMQMFQHLLADFDWAYPFTATDYVKVGAQRLDFRMAYEF